MKTISLQLPDEKSITVQPGVTTYSIIDQFNENELNIAAVRVNNEICSLAQPMMVSAKLEPILLQSSEGSAIYRRSLCFVLAAAAHILFPGIRLLVGHSLGYGYYYTLESDNPISENEIIALKNEMHNIIKANKPISLSVISYEEAVSLFEELNLTETRKQLNYHCRSSFTINTMDKFSDLYFGPLVYSTGVLKLFDLMPYQQGFLLRFPATSNPDKLTPFVDMPELFSVYERYKSWGKMLGVTSSASLNQLVNERKVKDFINITETFQTKCIADIADKIHNHKNVKMVLIAGPSSSGKTTTSKKLSMQLQALGYKPCVIELDTYYIGHDRTPKDEYGNYDYECLEALDVQQLNDDLVELLAGKVVQMPSYDFKEGKRFYTGKTLKLSPNDILILEGIHGLNDKLTPLIPQENKFKIYLSALTQLNLDDHNRISTSDNRLIRRIVRDAQFRGKSAADTIDMWPNVQKGARLHIFPFQNNADAMLNTALDYELAVLKVYAEPLLSCVSPLQSEYSEASRLLRFLSNFSPIPANFVPGQSIIREFIGGSEFKY